MSYFEDKMAWNKKLDAVRDRIILPVGSKVIVTIIWPNEPERKLGIEGTGDYKSQRLLTALWSTIENTIAYNMVGPEPKFTTDPSPVD